MDQKIWDTNVKSIEEWLKGHPNSIPEKYLSLTADLIHIGNAKSSSRASMSYALEIFLDGFEGKPEILHESGHPYPLPPCEICGGTGKGDEPCNVCQGSGMVVVLPSGSKVEYNPDDPDDVEYFSSRTQSCNDCDDGTSFCDDCGGVGY